MISSINSLYKSSDIIKFGWNREGGAVTYNIYVGLTASSLSQLVTGIPDIASQQSVSLGKVVYDVTIESVRTLLSLASTVSFTNKTFYFAITYVDSVGSESSLSDSTIVEVFPVGIISKTMKDDPTVNRHGYVYSDQLLRWTKMMGSSGGAVITDSAHFYKANTITEYSYDGTDCTSVKSYLSDATAAGSLAKLTTYTYSAGLLVREVTVDSTV